MSIPSILDNLPPELRPTIAALVDALEQRVAERYAVRRTDFEALTSAIETLTEAQQRSEERLSRVETVVEELAQAQQRTELRVEELAQAQQRTELRVEELAQAQQRTELRVEELAQAQQRTETLLAELTRSHLRLEQRVGRNTGILLELTYRDKAYAYFGTLLRKVRVVSLQQIEAQLEEHLSSREFRELLPLDLLVKGKVRELDPSPEVYLAVEISSVVDVGDVERAERRAALLRQAGVAAIPAVAGDDVTEGGEDSARQANVLLVQNGTKRFWDAALAQVLPHAQ
ncbi:MAG: hypothetical protein H6644_06000 [Caldilineaceae bacterium]|nr:hypothetical protein [Caldilineaceae bacterium]